MSNDNKDNHKNLPKERVDVNNRISAKESVGGQIIGKDHTTGKYALKNGSMTFNNYSIVRPEIETRSHKKDIITKPSLFRGEKPVTFTKRTGYQNQINEYLKIPGKRVSLVGFTGSGKSTLAYRSIHECEDNYDLIIPLYFKPNLTYDEFLSKLAENIASIQIDHFKRCDIDEKTEILLNVFADKNGQRILLLADNYETISGPLNRLTENSYNKDIKLSDSSFHRDIVKINDFLNSIPTALNTTIVITSTQRKFNLDGEKVIPIEGMKPNEGVELFIVLSNDDEVKKSDELQKIIYDIVDKTRGHPLSIELLARSYSGLGSKELRRMYANLGFDIVNPRQDEERLKSLELCFEYSLRSLGSVLKDLLYKLFIMFKSPFTLNAAVKILGINEKTLISLYNHSMLERIESDGYGIFDLDFYLYRIQPMLGNYLERKINTLNEFDDIERIYAKPFCEYYQSFLLNFAESMNKGQANFLDVRHFNIVIEEENNDFVRIIYLTEKYIHLDTVDKLTQFIGYYIYQKLGFILFDQNRIHESKLYLEKAKELAEKYDNESFVAESYANIGYLLTNLNDYEGSNQYCEKIIDYYEKNHEKQDDLSKVYTHIGINYEYLKDIEKASKYYSKGLEIAEEEKDEGMIADIYANLAHLYHYSRIAKYEIALKYYEKAEGYYKKTEYNRRLSLIYLSLANLQRDMGNIKNAEDNYQKSLDIAKLMRDTKSLAEIYYSMADFYSLIKQENKEQEAGHKALELYINLERATGFYSPRIDILNKKYS
jgi:tetratricopeptide (TPR) repeat protein